MPLYPPATEYYLTPAEQGFIAENMSFTRDGINTTAPTVAGRLELAKIKLPVTASITNVIMMCNVVGATLTAGQCFAALYTEAGARIGVTADQAANWVSTGMKTMALASGPFTCTAGKYYVGFFYNGTTSPSWSRSSNAAAAALNTGTTAPTLRWCSADTGLTTTMPANLGAQTAQSPAYWVALS